ncbi:MAG: ATP-dependent Clp protease adaptor ClpS [Elusimicrobia bacterium]|nr:ATP-dependent Clp protease adaptor ClpS [Elusimicrobiota bacterium]
MPTVNPVKEKKSRPSDDVFFGWKTILFNCDCHTFADVIVQLLKAIRCTRHQAETIAWQVHNTGSAVVYQGPREKCEAVAAVLEDIKLKVNVAQ